MVKTKSRKLLTLFVALSIMATMMVGLPVNVGAADTAVTAYTSLANSGSVVGATPTAFTARTGTGNTSAGTEIGGNYATFTRTTATNRTHLEVASTLPNPLGQTYVYSFDVKFGANMTKGFAAILGTYNATSSIAAPAFTYDATNKRFYLTKFYDKNTLFGTSIPSATGTTPTANNSVSLDTWYSIKMVINTVTNTTTAYYRATDTETTYIKIGDVTGYLAWTAGVASRQNFVAWTTAAAATVDINLDNINLSKPDPKSVTVDYDTATQTAYSPAYSTVQGTAVSPVFTCAAKWYLNQTGYTIDPSTATVDLPNNSDVVTFGKAATQPLGDNTTFTAATGTLTIPVNAPVGVYTIEGKSTITPATITTRTFEVTAPTASGVVSMNLASSNGDTFIVDPAGNDVTTAMTADYTVSGISTPSTTWSVDGASTALGITIDPTSGALTVPKTAAIAQSGTPTTITVTGTSSATLTDGLTTATATKIITLKAPLKAATFNVIGPSAVVINDATKSYSATSITDQYGQAIAGRTVAWSVVGAGATINDSTGALTAGADIADVTVTATIDGVEITKAVCIANYTGTLPTGTLNTNYTYINIGGESLLKMITAAAFASTTGNFQTINSDFMITELPSSGSYQNIYAFTYGGGQCTNGSISVGSDGSIKTNSGTGVFTQILPAGTVQSGKWYNLKAYVYLKETAVEGEITTSSASFIIAITPAETGVTNLSNAITARNSTTYTSLNLFVGGMNSGYTSTGTVLFKNTLTATGSANPMVTTTKTGNGSVTLSGADATLVASEATGQAPTKTYTITPDANHRVSAVTFNGASVTVPPAGGTYTTPAIIANSTLNVTFEAIPQYTVTPSAGSNGSISAIQTVNEGTTATFTITPDSGYIISAVIFNNGTTDIPVVVPFAGGTYTTPAITANSTISVTFEAIENSSVKQLAGGETLTVVPVGGGASENISIGKSVMAYANVQIAPQGKTILEQGMLLIDNTIQKAIYLPVDTKSMTQFAVRLVNVISDAGLVDGRTYEIKSYVKYTDNSYWYGAQKTFTWSN